MRALRSAFACSADRGVEGFGGDRQRRLLASAIRPTVAEPAGVAFNNASRKKRPTEHARDAGQKNASKPKCRVR